MAGLSKKLKGKILVIKKKLVSNDAILFTLFSNQLFLYFWGNNIIVIDLTTQKVQDLSKFAIMFELQHSEGRFYES